MKSFSLILVLIVLNIGQSSMADQQPWTMREPPDASAMTLNSPRWLNSLSPRTSMNRSSSVKYFCRGPSKRSIFTDINEFTDAMCTYCLYTMYTPKLFTAWKQNYTFKRIHFLNTLLYDNSVFIYDNQSSYYYYEINYDRMRQSQLAGTIDQDPILQDFSNDFFINQFLKCCHDSRICCEEQIEKQKTIPINLDDRSKCPMLWDGWSCWNSAEPNTINEQQCTDMSMITFENPNIQSCLRSNSQKTCRSNGEWIQHTIYHDCSIMAKNLRENIVNMNIWVQTLSLILTIFAIIIFITLKLYKKFYIKILLHFFISILLSTLMSILYNVYVTKAHINLQKNAILNSTVYCRSFIYLFKQTRLINYSWMLIEGLFLHCSAIFVFYCHHKISKKCWPNYFSIIIGWLFPIILMLTYVLFRLHYESIDDGNRIVDKCWTESIYNLDWIYLFYPYVCFFLNFILYLNLIRYIFKCFIMKNENRLNNTNNNNNNNIDVTGIKLAIFLIPIFGLQYLVHIVPINPTDTCDQTLIVIFYIQNLFESLQGLIVTLILCYMNIDVYNGVRKLMKRYFQQKNPLIKSRTQSVQTNTLTISSTPTTDSSIKDIN